MIPEEDYEVTNNKDYVSPSLSLSANIKDIKLSSVRRLDEFEKIFTSTLPTSYRMAIVHARILAEGARASRKDMGVLPCLS